MGELLEAEAPEATPLIDVSRNHRASQANVLPFLKVLAMTQVKVHGEKLQ